MSRAIKTSGKNGDLVFTIPDENNIDPKQVTQVVISAIFGTDKEGYRTAVFATVPELPPGLSMKDKCYMVAAFHVTPIVKSLCSELGLSVEQLTDSIMASLGSTVQQDDIGESSRECPDSD